MALRQRAMQRAVGDAQREHLVPAFFSIPSRVAREHRRVHGEVGFRRRHRARLAQRVPRRRPRPPFPPARARPRASPDQASRAARASSSISMFALRRAAENTPSAAVAPRASSTCTTSTWPLLAASPRARLVEGVLAVDVGAAVEQERHELQVAAVGRERERGAVVAEAGVHGHALVEERLHRGRSALRTALAGVLPLAGGRGRRVGEHGGEDERAIDSNPGP